jgi:predicted O-linked N-acetylglucosamine transferase (SPINDLY family)
MTARPFGIMSSILFAQALRHFESGQWSEAEFNCRRVLTVDPRHAGALQLLGRVCLQTGRTEEALTCLESAVAADASVAESHFMAGLAALELSRFEQAAAAFRALLALQPKADGAWHNLGAALYALGRPEEAIAAYREGVALAPDYAETWSNLAVPLTDLGCCAEAEEACRRAVTLSPKLVAAHFNLGNVLSDLGKMGESIEEFQKVIALDPAHAMARCNLATQLNSLGRYAEAARRCQEALALEPKLAIAHNNLGLALKDLGRQEEALESLRRACELEPASPAIYSNYLACLHYSPRWTLAAIRQEHEEYERLFGRPRAVFQRAPCVTRERDRPLRVAFVSSHFCAHPVSAFSVRLLEALAPGEIVRVLFSDTRDADAMTARMRGAAAEWHETRLLDEVALAEAIRGARIDILFDLSGHTAGNRLPTFARKPAPIQITWCDYVGTTGLAAMDYLLADEREVPRGSEGGYTEKILRMPDDYICFDPPAAAPEPDPLPVAGGGGVTFINCSVLAKVTGEVIAAWSEVMQRVPGSRMIIKNRGVDEPETRERLRAQFAGNGIAAERLELLGWSPGAELLAVYQRADLSLDTFPYNSGLTTCEALWMGVPVVSWCGETFAGRHGLTHLTAAGLGSLVARDRREFVRIAVDLASNLPRLATLRATLRRRVAASPLCDGPRFAAAFSRLMREVWRKWVADPV